MIRNSNELISEVGDALGNKKESYTIADIDGRSRRFDYVTDGHGFRATVKTNEHRSTGSAIAAALISSPYAEPVAPVVNHVAPAVAAPVALAAPAVYGGVLGHEAALGHVAPAAAVVGHAASYAAPLAVAAPLAAPLAVAAPVAYGGVVVHRATPVAYGGVLGHGAILCLAAPAAVAYGAPFGLYMVWILARLLFTGDAM
ncbi:UNVERIFIED_CONTAM: Adult-specific rigid cuticular protein 15.5 [Trichonephila clavipes]